MEVLLRAVLWRRARFFLSRMASRMVGSCVERGQHSRVDRFPKHLHVIFERMAWRAIQFYRAMQRGERCERCSEVSEVSDAAILQGVAQCSEVSDTFRSSNSQRESKQASKQCNARSEQASKRASSATRNVPQRSARDAHTHTHTQRPAAQRARRSHTHTHNVPMPQMSSFRFVVVSKSLRIFRWQ